MGIAVGDWQNASGQTNAFVTMAADGSVSVVTGQVDITGLHTVMAQIVAEELGVPVEKVTVTLGDTDTVPYTSLSAGSKAAYSAGTAARKAAWRPGNGCCGWLRSGWRWPRRTWRSRMDGWRWSARRSTRSAWMNWPGWRLIRRKGRSAGRGVLNRIPTYPTYSVEVATVEVDTGTGQVRLIDLVAAQDVGRALNPMLVEGQMQGGAVQSISFGLMEGYRYDDEGRVLNPNLLDYAIPTALDVRTSRRCWLRTPANWGHTAPRGWANPRLFRGCGGCQRDLRCGGRKGDGDADDAERVVAALRD